MLIDKILKEGAILKSGKDSTEWTAFKIVCTIGVVLILVDKFELAKLTPQQIVEFANTAKAKTDEYIGAIMVLVGAVSYIAKRGLLKYFELKELAAAALKQQEIEIQKATATTHQNEE